MPHRFAQTGLRLLCIIVLCAGLIRPDAAFSQADIPAETRLGDQLAIMVGPQDMPPQSRIALAPPPPLQSALPMAQIEAVMARVVQNMVADWPVKPRILAGSADLRSTLALVQGRQGHEAWRQTVDATLRQEAEFVLVAETGIGEGHVTLRLTLVALEDGRVLAKTRDVAIDAPTSSPVASPRQAITAAINEFQQTVPAARAQITIGPFVNERSGIETPLGRGLADMAVEAWLTTAQSVTAMLRDASPPVVTRGAPPQSGFFLAGTVRLVNRDQFQLILRLSNGQNLWATRTLALSALHLPPALRASLDPNFATDQTLLEQLQSWSNGAGPAGMDMQVLGGTPSGFISCKTPDFSDLHNSCPNSLIQLVITSDTPGALVCFSLDDTGVFSLILPNAYAASPWVSVGQSLILPDSLPPLPDGTRVFWPAMGPPSQTLVSCLLFEHPEQSPTQTLTEIDGAVLRGSKAQSFLGILTDSAPIGSVAQSVEIID
ncbi:hypothetical protein [uncultured Pelagimonas sp.]|uniref:hypothetical protein n=1 Tax=uncultured Pelagimonas sp. TaxID=1618102 RepID=UPI0026111B94|nr:hypothetical protein [uncultured Pelagimonas sp.]